MQRQEFSVSIGGDMIDGRVTRGAANVSHAARLAATEGQNGEVVTVIDGQTARRFVIVNSALGQVRKVR